MGTLYGKRERLLQFQPYKVRPASDSLPDRWETGTQVQELIAGIGAAVDYLAELGRRHDATATNRRSALLAAYRTTHQHETSLLTRLVPGLLSIPKLRFFGISDPSRSTSAAQPFRFASAIITPRKSRSFSAIAASSPGMEITMR